MTEPDATKPCPFCGEQILPVAIKCRHCQSDLRGGVSSAAPATAAPAPEPPKPEKHISTLRTFALLVFPFATLFIGSYDPTSSTLSYCCAGHNPPYLLQNGKMSQLSVGGCPVGLIADVRYEEAVVTLDAGDLFVIYTDGITEARSLSGEMFGEERLERVILDCSGLSCEEVQSQILETVREFSLGVEQADDQTLVVGKIV